MRRMVVAGLERLCGALDRVPYREDGKWYPGCYGCRLGLTRLSLRLEDRWQTDTWKAAS